LEDIVRGFEYEKGTFVVVDAEDFERANARKTKTIDVLSFTNEKDIDLKYVDKPFYLEPDERAGSAYILLREALRSSKKVGVAKFVIREREHLGMIKTEGDAIMLVQLRFADEVKPPSTLEIPGKKKMTDQEMKLALLLIDQLTKPFRVEEYQDSYTEELERVIAAKAKGKRPAKKGQAPVATAIPDLMDVLRKSLEQEQKGKKVRAKV
jgi:DNA end-binding protein Ku